MRKIAYAFASITVASCLGYFAGKGASYFKPQEESSDFASKSIKTKFKSLKLRPLPTKPEAFASLKSMAEIEKFLVPYHERGDMKWDPGYSVYIPAFDSYNRPYFRYHNRVQNVPVANGFQTLHQGDWTHYPINPGIIASLYDKKKQDLIYNSQQDILWDPKMAVFDADDTMYTVLRFKTSTVGKDTSYVMLYSKDKGLNWKALPLAGTANTQCVFKNQFFSKCKVPELYDLERPYS
ncbi:MAG: hypothetical protein J7501_08250, partial [Bdellovibrio sp.]|nr:hypothetical protein [Bdellovibrio sp.]